MTNPLQTYETSLAETSVLTSKAVAGQKAVLIHSTNPAPKYAEGQITAEEYAESKAQRQAWRDEINQMESEL